jgi:Tol biopolymer transport system component
VQLTKFPDSVTQPALSPDGRTVAFIRGDSTFIGSGQIYVKTLPDGEPVQLTHDSVIKSSLAFSPDGNRVAYTTVDQDFHWDTWVVPVRGGDPQLLLKNASGLEWCGRRQILFSEMKKGIHMGIVAAGESRVGAREVYLPADDAAMAHRSYPSPDGKWVLLVEMDGDHLWLPCRVVPADGSSPGRQVGPSGGGCTSGAWSPDGSWIYLTSNAVETNHIWRQRFPDGQPEQITSGPTEEEGIAMTPDGRSFVTSVSLQNSSLWLHNAAGEREISLEGNADQPEFTRDGGKLLYRIVREAANQLNSYRDLGEVWVADLQSGRSEPLARGFQARDYDISPDDRKVVMEAADREGKPRLWLAPLDRSSPPHQSPTWSAGRPDLVRAAKSSSATAPKGAPRKGEWQGARGLCTAFASTEPECARRSSKRFSCFGGSRRTAAGSRHWLRFQATAPHLIRPFHWMGSLRSLLAGSPSDGQSPVRQDPWVLYHFFRNGLTRFLWRPTRFCRRYRQEGFIPMTK